MACCIERVVTFTEPIQYHDIKIFDTLGNEYSATCRYAWSDDGVCWSEWASKDQFAIHVQTLGSDFFLKILIHSSLKFITFDNETVTCWNIVLYQPCVFKVDTCSNNLFNPYINLDCALMLQTQLANSIICMLGLPIYYFKVSPQEDTADWSFKEYVMHQVEDVKQIKMMIADGTLPTSKGKFTEWDYAFDTDWEVELGKTDFARAFGDDAYPKQRDMIYCPMTKKMYEVNSAYDEKAEGLLYQSTTWKLALNKWNEKTNIEQGEFEGVIDSFVTSKYEETLHPFELLEQERETGIGQTEEPRHAANTLYNIFAGDAIRSQLTKDTIEFESDAVWHKSVQIARNCYTFTDEAEIIYQKQFCGNKGTILCLIDVDEELVDGDYSFCKVGNVELIINVTDGEPKLIEPLTEAECPLQIGKQIIHFSWNGDFAQVAINSYFQKEPVGVPAYKLKPQMYSFDFTNKTTTKLYNTELTGNGPVSLYGTCGSIYYFKVFNTYITKDNVQEEALKYTTTNKNCLINDLARPIEGSDGFNVK